jgi:hypothetical protein
MAYFERDPRFLDLSPLGDQLGKLAIEVAAETPGVEATVAVIGTDDESVRTAGDMYAQYAEEVNASREAQLSRGRIPSEDCRDPVAERRNAEETLQNGGILLRLAAENPNDAQSFFSKFSRRRRETGQSGRGAVRDPNA